MAMGVVNKKDFDSELAKSQPRREESKPEVIHETIEKGRGNAPEVPDSLRKLIGQTAVESGRQDALTLAKQFGISPSSVGAYSAGATSTATYNDRPNVKNINSTRERIARQARKKLVLALSKITDDKLNEAKVRDLAGIAKDMASVANAMEEKTVADNGNKGPTFVIYSPQFKKEETFDVVNSKE